MQSMSAASSAKKKIRLNGQRSRSRGYEKRHGRTLLVKYVATAGVGLHVDRTAHASSLLLFGFKLVVWVEQLIRCVCVSGKSL